MLHMQISALDPHIRNLLRDRISDKLKNVKRTIRVTLLRHRNLTI